MKSYSKLLVLIAVLLAAAVAVFIGLTGTFRSPGADALLVNDITESVKEHWDSPETLDAGRFGTELIVFDTGGLIRLSTADHLLAGITSPEDAALSGCLCVTLAEGNRYLGTLVLPDPGRTSFEALRQRMTAAAVAAALLFLLAGVLYGVYVHRTIIRPFRKMEDFAMHVAAGQLDAPLLLEQDNLFGAFTQSFDIMREELKASRSRENALKVKEKELVASLSHDLKTPITGIKLLCELLAVKVQDDYVAGKVSSIHQKAEQLDVLVSDLLSSTLDDLGEMTVTCTDEPSAILRDLIAAHDTQSLVRMGDIPECLLLTDRLRLSQVIGNLISNSYKYAGTPIEADCRIRDRYLELTLLDHGSGVPEEELPLLTGKFYRGKTNSAGINGSGLGLYIASELMEKMNGELLCPYRREGFCAVLMIPLS